MRLTITLTVESEDVSAARVFAEFMADPHGPVGWHAAEWGVKILSTQTTEVK